MKKLVLVLILTAVVISLLAVSAVGAKDDTCTRIKDGVLTYSSGHYLEDELIPLGYDLYGYNYQAHMFEGYYCNYILGSDGFPPYEGDAEEYLAGNPDAENHWTWPYRDVLLVMKWNDAWLSNKDCDDDGLLDRHYGYASYIDSGAWETNHMWGTYEDVGAVLCEWDYFVKIVAVPDDAYLYGGVWCMADGTVIGPPIWGQFAIIQQIDNDPCAGLEGPSYLSPSGPGFGKW